MCIYIYIYTYVYTYTQIYIYIYIYICMKPTACGRAGTVGSRNFNSHDFEFEGLK